VTANPKPRAEAGSIVTVTRQPTAVVKVVSPMSALREAHTTAHATLKAALPTLDAGTVGLRATLWHPPVDGTLTMEPGRLVERGFQAAGGVVPSELPAGRAAHLVFQGPWEALPGAWQTLFDWCAEQKLALAGTNWEIYQEENPDRSKQEAQLYALLA
jgi:effector-binding domain-containing protein